MTQKCRSDVSNDSFHVSLLLLKSVLPMTVSPRFGGQNKGELTMRMMSGRFVARSCLHYAATRRLVTGKSSSSNSTVSDILRQVQRGNLNVTQAEKLLQNAASNNPSPEETLQSFANLDHTRAMRTGFPEAVFAAGKTPEQVALILDDMALAVNKAVEEAEQNIASTAILATR